MTDTQTRPEQQTPTRTRGRAVPVLIGTAVYAGGGIMNGFGGLLTLSQATMSGNVATYGAGGGVYNAGLVLGGVLVASAEFAISNSTICTTATAPMSSTSVMLLIPGSATLICSAIAMIGSVAGGGWERNLGNLLDRHGQHAVEQHPQRRRHKRYREHGVRGSRLPQVQNPLVVPVARHAVDRVIVGGDAGPAAREIEPARGVRDAQGPAHAAGIEFLVHVVADYLELIAGDHHTHRVLERVLAVEVIGAQDAHIPRSRLKISPSSWPVAPTRSSEGLASNRMSSSTITARFSSR